MLDNLILGIDVGTTSVKAAVIDSNGMVCERFSETYATQRVADGYAEQDADQWMRLIDKAIDQFIQNGYGPRIRAIGLCSQVNTHVFVGDNGVPLMPAILWQDRRAASEAATLDAQVSDSQKVEWWGAPMPIDASNVLSRMAWVKHNKPDLWRRTKWVMLPKDYCIYKLTGEVTTDPLSNIGLVDTSLVYIPGVFGLVPESFDKLAPLVPVTDKVGKVRAGLPLAGVPVVSGTMDAWAGIIGSGGAEEGASVYLSGTSEILGITATTVVPTRGVVVFPPSNSVQIHAAPTQSGGDAQLWFTEMTGMTPDAMAKRVADTTHHEATPLFLPQLEGERAPLWDANLRAAFLGLSRRTQLGDMARAVYEGVALSARYALETLQSSADTISPYIGCAGGGFRSETWNQIRADVLGVECRVLAAQEPGVLGASMIAGIGAGHYSNLLQAHKALVHFEHHYEPNELQFQRYSQLFELYKDAISTNAELTRRKSAIQAPSEP